MLVTKYNNLFSIVVLNSIHPLSREANKFLSRVMVCNQYKKGDLMVKSGEICDRLHLIRKGLVRGYFDIDEKEITTWVSVDNDMVTSISGYFKKEPALENIQCLEDTFTESISFNDMQYALDNYSDVSQLFRIVMQEYYVYSEHRSFLARIPKAKDRYEYFLKIYNPEIITRLPKKYIASLINIRPETLSRLIK